MRRRVLFAAGVVIPAAIVAWLLRAPAPVADEPVPQVDTSAPIAAGAGPPRAARTAPTRPPPMRSSPATTPAATLPPLAAATLAYYDRPGVRVALMQLRAATRHRCSRLVEFPTGERRLTFRVSSELSADGVLEASSVVPDGNRAADCIREEMRGVHLPAADGPTPLQINLSFLY